MEQLVEQHPEPSAHFAHELVAHLYDEEAALPMVTGWLERFLRAPLHEVMQQEHLRQTVQQTALANLINSCRRLAPDRMAGTVRIDQPRGKRTGGGSGQRLCADRF